jgi:hypothetical protein
VATPGVDVLPDASTETGDLPRVLELAAVPGGKLRYMLTVREMIGRDARYTATGQLVTVDTARPTAPVLEELPFAGHLWALDEARTLIAVPGGVLGRGVEYAGALPPEPGSARADDDGISENEVPYEQIFCDQPDVTGQTIVVPCVTGIMLSIDSSKPTPGGSHCNGGWSYSVSLVENTFSWAKCLEGASPTDPWELDRGEHELTDAELSALVDSLKVLTLSSTTACAGPDDAPQKTAWITTRNAQTKYLDSYYGCVLEELFVDHIDEALDLLDAMAHE